MGKKCPWISRYMGLTDVNWHGWNDVSVVAVETTMMREDRERYIARSQVILRAAHDTRFSFSSLQLA